MAAVCKMDESKLIGELLGALAKDVKALSAQVEQLPTQPPPDHRASIEHLTNAVQALDDRLKQTPANSDPSAITAQLDRIEHNSRQHPDRKASQYVQIGAIASGVMAVLLIVVTSLALNWRSERNGFEASDWKWRNLRQYDPVYVAETDSIYQVASQASDGQAMAGYQRWIIKQEQADATREAARKAAEQAAALTKQANQLEGTKRKPNS